MIEEIMTKDNTELKSATSGISDEERLEVLRNKDGNLPMLTDEQKQAVLSKGHILVSAAAGSGKTYTMVQRIMLMVAEGFSMRDMLVLVYNTAAAEELKNKLHTELFKMACSARGEERERFRKELDDLPFCHICTIHSFCNALIRDNFDKLGISPSFEVLDEKQHGTYMNTALDNVFESYASEGDEAFDDIVEIFSQARREDNLRANVIKLHTLIDIQPNKQGFYDKVRQCYAGFEDSDFMRVLHDYYAAYFKEAERKLAMSEMQLSKTSLEKYKIAMRVALVLCDEMSSADSFRKMCGIAAEYEKPDLGRRTKIDVETKLVSDVAKDYFDEIFEVCGELKNRLSEFDKMQTAHAQNAVYIDKIIELSARFDDELTKLKQADNVLSFEDLQHLAVRLLTDYPELGSQYSAVFVDEYQDVNPTQEFIIGGLVRDECFMVGDVKQSIYGFRLADPKIFLSRQKKYKNGDGIAIDFNRNFRSARAILEFVNAVFDVVMTEESADVDYKNTSAFVLDGMQGDGFVQVHLFTNKKAVSKTVSGLYDITKHEQDEESVSGAQFEGAYIAKQIKQLVKGGAITDGRRISYGDIAVLFRSRSTNASKIVEQLKLAGIPVDEGVFEKSASNPERELVSMLRVIDNPRQDIPLAGFLLSFFGGYNESELAVIAAESGECLYDKVMAFIERFAGNDDNDKEKSADGGDIIHDIEIALKAEQKEKIRLANRLRATFEIIDNYRLKASFKSVSDLMGGIVSDFCYDAYLMKAGEADVCGLKSFIASVSERDNKSLGRFLDGYSETSDNRISTGGGDKVQISTFHSYKGLEIPIVFVADTACSFNSESRSGDLTVYGNGYVGLRYFDFENKFKYDTLSKLAVSKLNRLSRIKEEMRLFYVALTRAKQMMYVTASVADSKCRDFGVKEQIGGATCDLDFISSAICAGADVHYYKHSADECEDIGEVNIPASLPADEKMVESIKELRKFVYPHKVATQLAMKYSVSALDKADEPTVNVYDEGAGAELGTLYHRIMQHIDFFTAGEDGVKAELERLTAENILTQEECGSVDVGIIARCLDSEVIKLAADAQLHGKCLREQPFMMYRSAIEISSELDTDDKVLVQGIVDLFIDGKSKILVDFKYSRMDDKRLVEKYKKQLYLYKTAIEGAIRADIDRIVIYSFRTSSTLEIPV